MILFMNLNCFVAADARTSIEWMAGASRVLYTCKFIKSYPISLHQTMYSIDLRSCFSDDDNNNKALMAIMVIIFFIVIVRA
jgi:hypothetical protein